MNRQIALAIAVAVVCCCPASMAGTSTQWAAKIYHGEQAGGTFGFGAWPGCQDGWDGQTPANVTANAGVYINIFKTNSSSWSGDTGFYSSDLESPIPSGGSKTWSDIRLWSYNYTPRLGDRVETALLRSELAPPGYWGKLVLDYTPASMNWTGATEWIFPLYQVSGGYGVPALPCPITDDPFNPENVTRMHLTVYTYPVPEPSSLAGIGFALASVGAGALRRRRK